MTDPLAEFKEIADKLTWRSLDDAPRDGTEFLAWCCERPAWSQLREFPDFAHWTGSTPDSKTGFFASRSGGLVSFWMPLPPPPSRIKD